jgi:hypothetical protein
MKATRYILFLSVVLCIKSGFGQTMFKITPTLSGNYGFYGWYIIPNIGAETSFEFGLGKKSSMSLNLLFQFGNANSVWKGTGLKQHDLTIGVSPEYKVFFKDRYEGSFLGFGADIKLLSVYTFYPGPPKDTYDNYRVWEYNLSIAYGKYFSKKTTDPVQNKVVYNPFIRLGFNPLLANFYSAYLLFGFGFGFQ